MSIVYRCRHCGQQIGKLDQKVVDTTLLGFNQLSVKEKEEMIHYQDNGNILVKSICESCEESLGRYPEYHELDFFIQ